MQRYKHFRGSQPRPQGLLAFQYGGGRREDPGTQRTKTIADWCILLRVHTCALIGLFIPKQRWLSFEGFVEAEKCFLQCLRPKWWTKFRSDCSENCDCTVGRQRFEDSDIACLPRARPFSLSPATSKRLLRRLRKLRICPKVTKMGSMIGRIDCKWWGL